LGRRGGEVKVVFLGTPESAVPTLQALLSGGHAVALVVTQPDRPSGRSGAPRPPAVKAAALAAGLPVLQPERVKAPGFRDALAGERPDALVVVAYGRLLPEAVLEAAPLGAINVHFSLLPRYRGAAPVQWALAGGEEVTGVTTMLMNARMDEGDVLFQREVRVEPAEHAPALTRRLAEVGAAVLLETLAGLQERTIARRPQHPAAATYARLLTASDGQIDPGLSAAEIEGRVRGFDPWPGVWVSRAGKRVRIVDANAIAGAATGEPPGTVIGLDGDAFRVACGDGTVLAVRRIQPEGGRAINSREAKNGRHLAVGDRLGRIAV
jgi:methionyl-tRNA formyltransferase